MVNPPLASTAVGVVPPDRAGMASGINSTFRQVGIATGIALLGTLFSNKVSSDVISGSQRVPALAGKGQQLATAVQSGDSQQSRGRGSAREPADGAGADPRRVHRRAGSDPAGRGDHRARGLRDRVHDDPQQGLRGAALTGSFAAAACRAAPQQSPLAAASFGCGPAEIGPIGGSAQPMAVY